MNGRDYKLYLQEIYDAITEIEDFTLGLSLEEFRNDKLRIKGCICESDYHRRSS